MTRQYYLVVKAKLDSNFSCNVTIYHLVSRFIVWVTHSYQYDWEDGED